MQVLVIGNYDSFACNLVQYLGELKAEVPVWRDEVSELLGLQPDRIVVLPGPRTPNGTGISRHRLRSGTGVPRRHRPDRGGRDHGCPVRELPGILGGACSGRP